MAMNSFELATGQSFCLHTNECKIFRCDHQQKITSQMLQKYYEEKKLCDIVLLADGDRFPAHRVILSGSSEYFQAMFRDSITEAQSEVELRDIRSDILSRIIDFMYTATIELRSHKIESLMAVAETFEMKHLLVACCDFIGELLHPSNCLGIVAFAGRGNFYELENKAFAYACDHFNEVWPGIEFPQLDEDQLRKYISSDYIVTQSEADVFRALVAWIDHDKVNRGPLTVSLLSHIRFVGLNPGFITDNRRLVCQTMDCYEVICRWLEWHLVPQNRSPLAPEQVKPRRRDEKLLFLYGKTTTDLNVQSFNRDLNTWSRENWPRNRHNRSDFSVTTINNQVIIAGGVTEKVGRIPAPMDSDNGSDSQMTDNDNQPTDNDNQTTDNDSQTCNLVECLDLQTMEWKDLPNMHQRRRAAGMIELDGNLYVVGGFCEGELRSMEKYDFTLRVWIKVASLHVPSQMFPIRLAVLEGLLYAVTDCNMQCYNPVSNKWTMKAFDVERVDEMCFGRYAGHLYIVGSDLKRTGFLVVKQYTPSADSWKELSAMPLGQGVACGIFQHRIIGVNEEWVIEHNLETQGWQMLNAALPFKCSSRYINMFSVANSM